MNAALTLFAEHGFEATSIDDIAASAGVAVGGFYQHFRSKRQALLVLMDRLVSELGALELMLPEKIVPRPFIAAIVNLALRIDWAYVGAYRAWREVILHDPDLAARNRTLEAWTLARLRVVTAHLLTLPGARSDVDLDAFCWVTNQLFWRLTEAEVQDRTAVERVVTAFFLHALFKDPS
jgi:AcrR family transcriptional regulator